MADVITVAEALDEQVDVQPQRVTLIRDPGTLQATPFPVLFNPEVLNEEINAQWSKLQVIGLDHEVPHYTNTRSLAYNLDFYWSEFQYFLRQRTRPQGKSGSTANTKAPTPQNAMAFMNFLRSLCFPTRAGLRPPTLQIVWADVFDLIGVVEKVSFSFIRFDVNLAPIVYRATVSFLETRVTRRYSEDVAQYGLQSDGFKPPGNKTSR